VTKAPDVTGFSSRPGYRLRPPPRATAPK
jgi:hypothetical protein